MAITAAQLEVRVGSDVSGALAGLNKVNSAITGAGRFFANAASTALGFIGATAGIAGISAAVDAAKGSIFGLNSQLEQAGIGFDTMLGGAEPAAAFIAQLADFAEKTPFDFPNLVTAAQRLVATGVAADQVIPRLEATGAAAAALGAGTVGLERINRALQQMSARTLVTAEEMNQLAEVGVPAWQILADAIGKPVPEAMKLVEKRLVSADTFINAFMKTAQQRWVPAFQKQATTFEGAMSNLRDAASRAAATAFLPLFEAAKGAALGLQAFIKTPGFQAFIANVQSGVARAIALFREFSPVIGGELLALFRRLAGFVAGRLPSAIASLTATWEQFKPAVLAVAAVLPGLIDQIGPKLTPIFANLGPILTGAAAAFGVLAGASALGALVATLGLLLSPLGLLTGGVALLAAAWTGNWGDIRGKVTPIIDGLTQKFGEVRTWLETNLPPAIAAAQAAFATFKTWAETNLVPVIDKIKTAFQIIGEVIQNLVVEPFIAKLQQIRKEFELLLPFVAPIAAAFRVMQQSIGQAAAQRTTLGQGIATADAARQNRDALALALAGNIAPISPSAASALRSTTVMVNGPVVQFSGDVNANDPATVDALAQQVAAAVAGIADSAEGAEPSPPDGLGGVLP